MPVSGCGLRTDLGEIYTQDVEDYMLLKVVDCGQTLVSYTQQRVGHACISCGLRTDLGELHLTTLGTVTFTSCGLRTDLGELH